MIPAFQSQFDPQSLVLKIKQQYNKKASALDENSKNLAGRATRWNELAMINISFKTFLLFNLSLIHNQSYSK
jgi:hypothetical protein